MGLPRSQRPNLEVRVVAVLIILVLVLAFIALYVYPNFTDQDFAWTIKPSTTAILIGLGYMAGALFFVRVITARKWQYVQAGFLPITMFTIFMIAATFLHWNRFHQGTVIFILWTVIYLATPLLVPWLWWRNRGRDTHAPDEKDWLFPSRMRQAAIAGGAVGLALALVAFIWPSLLISITPWSLTELTARVMAGWFALAFATTLSIGRDGRWSAVRFLMQSFIFGQALALLAMPRMWSDLDPAHPMTYVFVGGLVVALVGLVILYVVIERRSRRVS